MYFAFNELSLHADDNSPVDLGRKKFSDYIRFLSKLKKTCNFEGIVAHEKPWAYGIAKDYTVYSWISDPMVNQDLKRYAMSLLNEFVIIEQFEGDVHLDICPSVISKGGTAVWETPEVTALYSFLSDHSWEDSELAATYDRLNDNGDIDREDISLRNYNSDSNLKEIAELARDIIYKEITSTSDLWARRKELFPNLEFCDSVQRQLEENPGRVHALAVLKQLRKLQEYFEKKHERYIRSEVGLKVRTESETVKTDEKLKAMRLFRLPSGKEEYFWEHLDFNGQYVGRIYILPDIENSKGYVGYIGRHLPTKKF